MVVCLLVEKKVCFFGVQITTCLLFNIEHRQKDMNAQPTTVDRLLGALAGMLLMFVVLLAAEFIKETPESRSTLSTKKATYKVAKTKTLTHAIHKAVLKNK